MSGAPVQRVNEQTRYVRVTGVTHGGFIEFQFAIGDPSLYLAMILPPHAYEEFCRAQRAVTLSGAQARRVDDEQRKWAWGDERETETATAHSEELNSK
jgi:phenol hydroxylase P0 protein